MKLLELLEQLSAKKLNKIAKHHQITYNPDFSKLWLNNKLKEKFSDNNYLKKLINTELPFQAKTTLKKLINTESIHKNSIQPATYQQLQDWGFIYNRDNFCYLPADLKNEIKNIFKDKKTTTYKRKIKKDNPETKIISTKKTELSFFIYLVLSLAYIKKITTKEETPKLIKKELFHYIEKINLSNISHSKLMNYILSYSQDNKLLNTKLKVTKKLKTWLATSHKKKMLSALNSFFPSSDLALRRIIAVLSYCPMNEKLPLGFLNQEFNNLSFNTRQKKLLNILNVFEFKDGHLLLSPLCWKVFNQETDFSWAKPLIKKEEIIVPKNIELCELWKISQQGSLAEMNADLKFQKNNQLSKRLPL